MPNPCPIFHPYSQPKTHAPRSNHTNKQGLCLTSLHAQSTHQITLTPNSHVHTLGSATHEQNLDHHFHANITLSSNESNSILRNQLTEFAKKKKKRSSLKTKTSPLQKSLQHLTNKKPPAMSSSPPSITSKGS